jgi:hypothetical protein
MTLDVYASLFEDDLDALSDRLDAAISQAPADSTRTGMPSRVVKMPGRKLEIGL